MTTPRLTVNQTVRDHKTPSSPTQPTVTLSNENRLSRFRPCRHPALAASAGHEPSIAPRASSNHPLVWSICEAKHKAPSGFVWHGHGRAPR